MVESFERVTPQEITALTHEVGRLMELGHHTTQEEWDDLREWKVDILNRIALDPGPFANGVEAAEVREIARREGRALRLGLPSRLGDEPCR